MIDKYSQLKIAATVLGKTMKELADEANCSMVTLRDVANDRATSARITQFISDKIAQADDIYREHRKQKQTA